MERVKVSKNMAIKLPDEFKRFVSEGDEFVISVIGDSLRLKKIKKPDLLDLAAAKRDKEATTLKEISRIVHNIRRSGGAKGSN